jgi:sugar phosphate isomerase/epimerase
MRFALFTATTPEWTPAEAAAILQEQGWDGVEWRVTDQDDAVVPGFWAGNRCTWPQSGLEALHEEIRALHERHALGIPNLGTYVSWTELDQVEAGMRAAQAIGAPSLRVRAHAPGSDGYAASFERARHGYREVARLAADYEVRALVETHPGDLVSSSSAARRFLDGFDPAHVGVIHNLGNMQREGYERTEWSVEILGPYLAHVHVKNAAPARAPDGGWHWEWARLSEGTADFAGLARALRAVGYDGWITVADFSRVDPAGRLEWSAANLAWAHDIFG